MPSVSVVIPNYNGQTLLEKHLPSVLKAMRNDDQLVVIDDASTDQSWVWLQQKFKTKDSARQELFGTVHQGLWSAHGKKGEVLLLRNTENQRFGQSSNLAVQAAKHPLVFLVNTDVSLHSKTIQQLVSHFEDSSVFAVGCLEHERDENGRDVLGGKNQLHFQRGLFIHQRASNFQSGETAWASGGSAMFDRQKWLQLGGFDQAYYPAYWEDVDLSFRAKKRGWKVLFDATAEVDHNHESTNTTAFGQKKMSKMSWQHAQTFVSRNATWKQKVQYLLWQPYWWLKGPVIAPLQLQLIFLGLILLSAVLLRFFLLAEVPHGMTWDEAAIGYNGWSVATKGRDEWLTRLPISFRSFGDYKASFAIYVVGAFTRFFGPTLLAVRLPFALSGVAAVVGIMIVVKLLWQSLYDARPHNPRLEFPSLTSNSAAILAGALLATSVWHIHYSRIGFESGMALNFVLWGMAGTFWLLLKGKSPLDESKKSSLLRGVIGVATAVSFAASLYTYHSSKIVVPLLLFVVLVFWRDRVRQVWKGLLIWSLFFTLLLGPLLLDSLFGRGADRFNQATIFRLSQDPIVIITTLFKNFIVHFTPAYLVHGQTDTLRHGSGQYGVLYLTELFLVLLGTLGGIYQWLKKKRVVLSYRMVIFGLAWIVIGTLPAVIGVDVPHSNRMLLALPGFIILAVSGWQWVAETFKGDLMAPAILGTTLLLQLFFVSSYLHHYYGTFAKTSAADFADGYLEAVEYAKQYEDSVDKVLFTNSYQQPYIYTLLGRRTTPYQYHAGSLIKYEFTDKITVGDLMRKNTLIIATPEQLDYRVATHLVKGSDDSIRFVIVKTE